MNLEQPFRTYESQVVLGAVLGGSSILRPPRGVNHYLAMRGRNDEWLRHKMAEMPTHFPGGGVARLYGGTWRCSSRCSEAMTQYRAMIFEGPARRPSWNLLDCLRDVGIAVWFLDGGGRTGRGLRNAYLSTSRFGESDELVCEWFESVGVAGRVSRDGGRSRLVFTVEGTLELFRIINPCVPLMMAGRILV